MPKTACTRENGDITPVCNGHAAPIHTAVAARQVNPSFTGMQTATETDPLQGAGLGHAIPQTTPGPSPVRQSMQQAVSSGNAKGHIKPYAKPDTKPDIKDDSNPHRIDHQLPDNSQDRREPSCADGIATVMRDGLQLDIGISCAVPIRHPSAQTSPEGNADLTGNQCLIA